MLEKVKRRKVEGIKIKRQQTKAPSPLERAGPRLSIQIFMP